MTALWVSAAAVQEETDKAMGLLHRAAANGYRNVNAFRTESALAPLHDRPDFRSIDDGPGNSGRPVRKGPLKIPAPSKDSSIDIFTWPERYAAGRRRSR